MHVWWLYTRPFLFDLQRVAHIFLAHILQMTFQTLDSVDLLYVSVNLFPQLRKRPSLIVFFKSVDVASPVNKPQLICGNSRPEPPDLCRRFFYALEAELSASLEEDESDSSELIKISSSMVLFDNCTLRRLYRALLSLPLVQVAEVQEGRTERSLVLTTGQVTFKECEEMSNLPSSLSWSNEWVIVSTFQWC